MLYLVYDSETTGLPDFSAQAEDFERHPGIAQLAAVLIDEHQVVHGSMNVILCQPDSVRVEEGATRIHGITREKMQKLGVNPKVAMRLFMDLLGSADVLVAHNAKFDEKMVRIELHRVGYGHVADRMREKPVECTMKLADPIMRMAPTEKMVAAGFTKSKPPKLEEAYEYFVGKPMENAHNAWDDVQATIAVLFAVKGLSGAFEGQELIDNGGI